MQFITKHLSPIFLSLLLLVLLDAFILFGSLLLPFVTLRLLLRMVMDP